jgi:RND family efflux transporter MFP subunit
MRPSLALASLFIAAAAAADVPFSGKLEPRDILSVRPGVRGRIEGVSVKIGDSVKSGQILARLAPASFRAALEQAKTRLTEAETRQAAAEGVLEEARRAAERDRELLKAGVITQAEILVADKGMELALSSSELARARVDAARQGLQEAEADLRETEIFSPAGGIILAMDADVGREVRPGQDASEIFRILKDPSKLQLRLRLPKEDMGQVEIGQIAGLRPLSRPDKEFAGIVSEISPLPDMAAGRLLYDVLVAVEDRAAELRPGMPVEGALYTDKAAGLAASKEGAALAPPTLAAGEKAFGDADLAVVVGIEDYPRLPASQFSRRDAELFARFLVSMGIREHNLRFLTDGNAGLDGLRESIESWLPRRVRRGGRVVVYYSGHGAPGPSSGEPYWVPADGDPGRLKDTGYSLHRLYEHLKALPAAEVLVVMDCAFSGNGGRSLLAGGAAPPDKPARPPDLPRNMAVLTAAQGPQTALASSELGQGLLTYHLLRSIKDGRRSLAEAYSDARRAVEREALRMGKEQTPQLLPSAELSSRRFLLRR